MIKVYRLFSQGCDAKELDSYFVDWIYGTVVMATINKKEAKTYATRDAYKKDLQRLNKKARKYKAIEG